MKLMRWQSPLREMDDLFDRTVKAFGVLNREWLIANEWNPRVDIIENDKDFTIHADLPGVAKDDLSVTVEDGVLNLKGERHQNWDDNSGHVHRLERFHGRFLRSFALPDSVDPAGLTATANDGELVITLPKRPEAERKEAVNIPVR